MYFADPYFDLLGCYTLRNAYKPLLSAHGSNDVILFCLCCRYAGLYCVVLTGYAKGRDFHPGDSFTGESNHSWNAVYVDENWHLVDTKWAAMSHNNNNSSVSCTEVIGPARRDS